MERRERLCEAAHQDRQILELAAMHCGRQPDGGAAKKAWRKKNHCNFASVKDDREAIVQICRSLDPVLPTLQFFARLASGLVVKGTFSLESGGLEI